MLDILTPGQWKLLSLKLRSAQAALEIAADEAFGESDYWGARACEQTMDELADVLAVA